MTALKPCPFCGARANLTKDQATGYFGPDAKHKRHCPIGNIDFHEYADRSQAIREWETRTPPVPSPASLSGGAGEALPSHPREGVRPAYSQTMVDLLDAFEQRVWVWAQGCYIDDISQRSQIGDSYNEGQRDDVSKARSALIRQVDALTWDDALATTSSPDASPDSGEAQYPDNTYTPYGRRSVHNLTELLEITEQRPTVVSVVNRAYDEIVFLRALAASPASLSGGVEEVAAELLDHYADFIRRDVKANDLERHPYLPLIEQTAADLHHPSPEAPANRQEAGEVEVAFEVWQGDELAAASSDEKDGWHYLAVYQQDGPATLVRAETRRTTLSSPKDVKGPSA